MYGREHIVIVRPGNAGILAHPMFYTDEVRFENEYRTDTTLVGPKEFDLAKTFLAAIQAPFAPEEFKDSFREKLQQLIASKRSSQQIVSSTQATPAEPPAADIMEALRKVLR